MKIKDKRRELEARYGIGSSTLASVGAGEVTIMQRDKDGKITTTTFNPSMLPPNIPVPPAERFRPEQTHARTAPPFDTENA